MTEIKNKDIKVCGFTIVRNAEKFDYPVVESIKSILPVCDCFIVSVGNSSDRTLEMIKSIDSKKIIIMETVWDDNLREGGRVLAVETNKALDAIPDEYDWAFYIQADEVVHEKYLDEIRKQMIRNVDDKLIEGLLLKYEHFYGSYNYVCDSRKWYRREIRIIKNDKEIRSWGDAQGFRKNGRKLNVKLIDACIYHYGWVKSPDKQQQKQRSFHRFWHPDEWLKTKVTPSEKYDYSGIDSIKLFEGTHPSVMQKRVENQNWEFNFDIKMKNMNWLNKLFYFFEKLTGMRLFEYRNYNLKK
ncbi:MAG: glycosyl transferase [Ignavibacteria bacterium]|nr:glycosyl transferase [Ignavibacteria bacterium]